MKLRIHEYAKFRENKTVAKISELTVLHGPRRGKPVFGGLRTTKAQTPLLFVYGKYHI